MRESRALEVCGGCHDGLQASASAAVSTTGEFALHDVVAYAEHAQMRPTPASVTPPSRQAATCTWCGRSEERVRKLLSSGHAHICDACIALCVDILTAELGENWGV